MLGLDALHLDRIVLEHLNGTGHRADFILALTRRNVAVMIAARQALHRIGHAANGLGNRAADQIGDAGGCEEHQKRSEEHTSELKSLMSISYSVFCLKNKHN